MDRRQFIAAAGATATAFAADPVWAKGLALNADKALLALLDAMFNDAIAHSPEYATSLGLDKGRLAPLRGMLSPATTAERHADLARARHWQSRLGAIKPALLSPTGQRYQARVKYMLEQRTLAPGKYDIDGVQTPYRLYQQGGLTLIPPISSIRPTRLTLVQTRKLTCHACQPLPWYLIKTPPDSASRRHAVCSRRAGRSI